MTKLWFRNNKTKKVFEVVGLDKEKGTITMQGSFSKFTEDYDKERFKQLGYELVKATDKETAATAAAQ